MHSETKERLREFAKKRRGTLLKDVTEADINVAVDWLMDQGVEPARRFKHGDSKAYIKYATPGQVRALSNRMFTNGGVVSAGPRTRNVTVFHKKDLRMLLEFLTGPNWPKYINNYY